VPNTRLMDCDDLHPGSCGSGLTAVVVSGLSRLYHRILLVLCGGAEEPRGLRAVLIEGV
jgi:hypothetical protein